MILLNFFSLSAVLCALLVVSSNSPINSIVNLILTFLNSVGLFILLGVDFIALLYIIVYVGAIAILFLFVVMMLNVRRIYQGPSWARTLPLALLMGILYLITFGILGSQLDTRDPRYLISETELPNFLTSSRSSVEALGEILYSSTNGYSLLVISFILLVGMIGSIVLTLSGASFSTLSPSKK